MILRGSATDGLVPHLFGGCPGGPGFAVEAAGSVIVSSGLTVGFLAYDLTESVLLEPVPPQPYLAITGTDGPGGERRILVYGPAGEPYVLVTSLVDAFAAFPGVEGLVWLDAGSPVHVVTLAAVGQDTAQAFLVPLPATAGLEGVALTAQALFPGLSGAQDPTAALVTNPASIVLR